MIPKRIIFFGSSSVHGYGDNEQGGFVYRFRLWHEAQSPRNLTYQLGLFGETTEALITRVSAESSSRKPHLIVLYPGFNDMRRESGRDCPNVVSVEQYRSLMTRLVSTATAMAPTIVITGFPFDESRTAPLSSTDLYYLYSDGERYTSVTREVCNENQVPVLDCFSVWQTLDWRALLAEDGLHANSSGHQVLFEQVRDFLVHKFRVV